MTLDARHTPQLADFVTTTRFEGLPPTVVQKAKAVIQDIIGVALAARDDQAVEAARRVTLGMGGKPEARLLGTAYKVPCGLAAWVNDVMATTLDMD